MINIKELSFSNYINYRKFLSETCRIKKRNKNIKLIFQKNIKKNIKILRFLSLIPYLK